MGAMRLEEWYFNWRSWKVWRNKYQKKLKWGYVNFDTVDIYNHIVWHIGPLKLRYKQFVETRYEYKAREET